MTTIPDGEPIEIDLSGGARVAEALGRIQASAAPAELDKLGSRFAEISRRAAESLGGWSQADADRFVPTRIEIPELKSPENWVANNTERLVEIASAQQELLSRFVADQEAASKVEARRHRQTVLIGVLCALLGASFDDVLGRLLT